jgi:hypothetical protein
MLETIFWGILGLAALIVSLAVIAVTALALLLALLSLLGLSVGAFQGEPVSDEHRIRTNTREAVGIWAATVLIVVLALLVAY